MPKQCRQRDFGSGICRSIGQGDPLFRQFAGTALKQRHEGVESTILLKNAHVGALGGKDLPPPHANAYGNLSDDTHDAR